MIAEPLIDCASAKEQPALTWEALASVAQYRPAALARAANLPLGRLQRNFSERYGLRVQEWLQSVRLKEAYQRLAAGDTVHEVASDLGYKRVADFSRQFKNRYGIAPSFLDSTRRVQSLLHRRGCIKTIRLKQLDGAMI